MKKQQKIALGVGAGAAALAAGAAATYLFATKKGKQTRKQLAVWLEKAQKDVAKELKQAKQVSKKVYDQAVDAVVAQYKKAKKIDPQDLVALAGELKTHWNAIAKEAATSAKKVTQKVQKAVVKKAASKKSAKKKSATLPSKRK